MGVRHFRHVLQGADGGAQMAMQTAIVLSRWVLL